MPPLEKSTPGPWEWHGNGHGEMFGLFSTAPEIKGRDVLRAHDGFEYSEYSKDPATIEVSEEDTHLIEAAPDMYAALKRAKKHIHDLAYKLNATDNEVMDATSYINVVLSKARGEP